MKRALLAAVLLWAPMHAAMAQIEVPTRLIRILQVDGDGTPIGAVNEIFCPPTGCQVPLTVTFEGAVETYMAAIDMVTRGIYVALTSRTLGTRSVVDFATGRPGPSFVTMRGRDHITSLLKFIVVRDASVRAERGADPEKTLAEGTVFNRARTPDILLRVEITVPEG